MRRMFQLVNHGNRKVSARDPANALVIAQQIIQAQLHRSLRAAGGQCELALNEGDHFISDRVFSNNAIFGWQRGTPTAAHSLEHIEDRLDELE
jgi:hypothetical protein